MAGEKKKRDTSNKRTPEQVEKDREEIARRVLRGESQLAIAKDLGISQQQISYDMRVIRERWKESYTSSYNQLIELKLAEYNLVKQVAWRAWDISNTTKETIIDKSGISDKGEWSETSTKREKLIGNPTYLSQILECIEKEASILGLPTELKYKEATAAIAAVSRLGYVIKEPDPDDDEEEREYTPEEILNNIED